MSKQRRTADPAKSAQNSRVDDESAATAPTGPAESAGRAGSVGPTGSVEPAGSLEPAGVWETRWDNWSKGQYLMTGIVLCALSILGHGIPAGGADGVRTVICLVVGIAGAAIIVVPWVGKLRVRPSAGADGAPARRLPVDERLRASPYPKALWIYSAWIALLSVVAAVAFLALAVGRQSPGFILGVIVFGVPAILFGSLVWTTRDVWSRA